MTHEKLTSILAWMCLVGITAFSLLMFAIIINMLEW